ncbi:MAG: transcription factor S [Candidatus Helarchaeota archaeon]|nr:transcription factor S [Candidatus Helarchaeota archaeon]
MEYCDDCGSIIYPMKQGEGTVLKCRRCGFVKEMTEDIDKDSFKITTEFTHSVKDKIEIIKTNDLKTMPTTRAECPKCGHKEAAYWQLQTRSADEGMTTFYRCVKCKHTWRAY